MCNLFSSSKVKVPMEVTIRQGNHKAEGSPFWETTMTNLQSARVSFDESCRYDIGFDQLDWNKLFGRSTNGFWHHSNSMRVAWRYRPELDQIEVGAYTYKKGQRQTEVYIDPRTDDYFETTLGFVNFNEEFSVSCFHEKYKYVFDMRVNDISSRLRLPAKKQKDWIPGVNLFTYFGGNRRAPHDMKINIEYDSR